MKTIFTTIATILIAIIGNNRLAAQDLVPGINYSYNPPGANGIITGIEVDVCNNESTDASWSFDVSMYLYDPNTSNYWVIGSYNVSGLSGNTCGTISNWDIDINQTSGIPAGTYRLGIWVDSNNDISETDENNNVGLLDGNINYSPATSGIKQYSNIFAVLNEAAPNPASGSTSLSFQLLNKSNVSLSVYDMTGKLIIPVIGGQSLESGIHSFSIDLTDLEAGVYFYTLNVDGVLSTKKLIVQ